MRVEEYFASHKIYISFDVKYLNYYYSFNLGLLFIKIFLRTDVCYSLLITNKLQIYFGNVVDSCINLYIYI